MRKRGTERDWEKGTEGQMDIGIEREREGESRRGIKGEREGEIDRGLEGEGGRGREEQGERVREG